jgi:hypothetical protein
MSDDGFWFIMFVAGLAFGSIMIGGLLHQPAYATLTALCDQKYGQGNWLSANEDGYWICHAKADPVCKVDGLGLERCKKQ